MRSFLLPGEYIFTSDQMTIETILGSCVSVCIYDCTNNMHSMNHYVLDMILDDESDCSNVNIHRYGRESINYIIDEFIRKGSKCENLRAQIFGGANSFDKIGQSVLNVGNKNIEVALEILSRRRVKIIKKDVGGTSGRKIYFNLKDNVVKVDHFGKSSEAIKLKGQRESFASRDIKVLVVDDSTLVRKIIKMAIDGSYNLEVCGEAKDAYEARELIIKENPDVVCLDIIMPRMSGLGLLRSLTKHYPIPVVICSTIAKVNSDIYKKALNSGAAAVIDKSELDLYSGMSKIKELLIPALKKAILKK